MAHWKGFTVQCNACRYVNRPDASPRKGVERIRSRSFTTCRGCGGEFVKYRLPARPLILEVLGGASYPHIEVFPYTTGHVPRGVGIVSAMK